MKYKVLLGFGVGLVVFSAVWSQSLFVSFRKPTAPPKQISLPNLTETLPDSIRIKAVGDMVPGTNFPINSLPGNPDQLFPSSVREKLRGSDLLFGNFESTITNHPNSLKDVSRGQVFAFRSPTKYAKLFAEVGFDVLSVANNHAMDFGKIGFQDTMNNINAAGIRPVGEKNQILFLNV